MGLSVDYLYVIINNDGSIVHTNSDANGVPLMLEEGIFVPYIDTTTAPE